MGTAAVFAIVSPSGKTFDKIIGMGMDGFPENLEYIASEIQREAKKLRKDCLMSFRAKEENAVMSVMETVVSRNSDWLFMDEHKNAQWVSYTGVFDPTTGVLCITGENDKATMKVIK